MQIAIPKQTMSSREIAELVESRHDNVKRSMETLRDKGIISFTQSEETSHDGAGARPIAIYMVNKRDSYIIVAQLSPEFTARLVDRWQELESQAQRFDPASLTRIDILKLAMESEEGRIKAEAERDHAIATKAQIGSKREATAMATAAKATREVSRLMERLGFNAKHATIKAVESATKRSFGPQGWRPLAAWCKAHGACAVDVPDPLYGTVKSWPADAWGEIYNVDLQDLFRVEA